MFTKCAPFQPIYISHCSHLPFHRDVLLLHTETVGTALTLSAWTNTEELLETEKSLFSFPDTQQLLFQREE